MSLHDGEMQDLQDGLIEPTDNSPIGFTPDIFTGKLFKRGDIICISLLQVYPAKMYQGHFRRLLQALQDRHYKIQIACPSAQMQEICQRYGFLKTVQTCLNGGCPVLERST